MRRFEAAVVAGLIMLALLIAALLIVGNEPDDETDAVATQSTSVSSLTNAPSITTTVAPTTSLSPVSSASTTEEPVVRTDRLFVAVGGVDQEDGGWSMNDPLATPSFAASISLPGDTIVIAAGNYGPLTIDTKSDLTVIATTDGPVSFTSGEYERGAGVLIENSENIVIEGINVTRSLWGIRVLSSTGITLRNNIVTDIGQEAIHILSRSSDVTIEGNRIDTTGQRPGNNGEFEYADLGEGVYLGTGGVLADGSVDDVSNVRIIGNDIGNTTGEAIDIKASVFDVIVRDNTIHDIDVHSGGALTIGRGVRTYDANVIVENNAIWNVSTRSPWNDGVGIRISSSATVRANVIWNVEHYGIQIEGDLRNADGGEVTVINNFIVNAGVSSVVNDGANTDVPISISGTVDNDEASELLQALGQDTDVLRPAQVIDYLNAQ